GLKGARKKVKEITEKILIKFVDEVITVNESIANEYVKNYNIEKPYILLNAPNYVKEEKFDLFRKEFKIKSNLRIYLYQGALFKGRRIEDYLDAFSQYKNGILIV